MEESAGLRDCARQEPTKSSTDDGHHSGGGRGGSSRGGGDNEVDWDSCSCATCHTCQQVGHAGQIALLDAVCFDKDVYS